MKVNSIGAINSLGQLNTNQKKCVKSDVPSEQLKADTVSFKGVKNGFKAASMTGTFGAIIGPVFGLMMGPVAGALAFGAIFAGIGLVKGLGKPDEECIWNEAKEDFNETVKSIKEDLLK